MSIAEWSIEITASAMIEAALNARIDFTRRFIAEEFTPLFHTREYELLPEPVRLRYNQLHAFYFNEQVAFFEQEMLSPALLGLQRCRLPSSLAAGLRIFFAEEQKHTMMFRAVNRRCAPHLYANSPYYFVQMARPLGMLLRALAGKPTVFPLVIWLALLQEERSHYYSKGCILEARELETTFVEIHRSHLADEVGHIEWDEELLDWLWPSVANVTRRINVRLLGWMLGEYFLLPKRSALRVVCELKREFPSIDVDALRRGLRGLETDEKYVRSLYSRAITPRSFARFDSLPEFALIAGVLPGYLPPDSLS